MLELVPISFTFASLAKVVLIVLSNMFVGYTWYSPAGFQNQWRKSIEWKEGDKPSNKAHLMSNIGTLLNSFLLHILLIAFDIRKQQFLSAILSSAILPAFYTFNNWNYVFFSKQTDFKRHLTLHLIDISRTFVLYSLISLILVSF